MDLKNIPGIGEKTIDNLNKINIFTINDLINYYPYKYNFYNPENINNATDNVTLTINYDYESTEVDGKIISQTRDAGTTVAGNATFGITVAKEKEDTE